MGDFIKGWQPKAGVVTLVVACVFAAGWIRSLAVSDTIVLTISNHTYVWLFSEVHTVEFAIFPTEYELEWEPYWYAGDIAQPDPDPNVSTHWLWHWGGFGFAESVTQCVKTSPIIDRCMLLSVPYWSIVISLTLLSAYLLLTKPRVATPTKTIEPDRA